MQVSSEISRLTSLDASRRPQASASTGKSFADELAGAQNLPSSLTGSSGGLPSLGMSLDTLLQAQGAASAGSALQPAANPLDDPLNDPQKPTRSSGANPLRSHAPMLNEMGLNGPGSEGPQPG